MQTRFFCLLVIALAACGPSPRRIVLGTGGPPQMGGTTPQGPTAPGSASGEDPLARLNTVNAHLESRGYRRTGNAMHSDISQTGLVAQPVEAMAGQCYIVIALGDSNANIDIIVVDPLGQNVGQNVYQDANPWVYFCATQPGRHVVRIQLVSGSGVHYYASYQGTGDPGLVAVLGGPAASQAVASADADVRARIAAVNQQLTPQNYEALLAEPMGYTLAAGQHDGVALQLAAGMCYRFAAFGGAGVRDVGLAVENSNNEMIQRDSDANRDASVEYCPVADGRFSLSATMVDGSGPLYVTGWRRPSGTRPQVTAVNNASVISANTGGGGGLRESFAALNANITARGYESYGDSARGSLGPGETRDFPLALEGGKCYAIVAQGDGRVSNLDLVLRDSRRREVDRDVAQDPRPIVRVCPERTGEYTMAVNMAQGGGDFVYQAYRWPRGTRGPFGLNGLMYVRLSEVSALLRQEGYSPSGGIPPGQGSLSRQGARGTHELELSGGCVAVLVVGGDGVHDLDVSVSSRRGPDVGEDSRNAFPSVRFCPSPGSYSLKVEAAAGFGPYFYQVFERN